MVPLPSGPRHWRSSFASVLLTILALVTGLSCGGVADSTGPSVVQIVPQISAGGRHTCGLTASGAAYCWGASTALGYATTNDRSTPGAVSGGLRFARIFTGEDRTCGLTVSGSAFCWGANLYGVLGDGTTISHSTPVAVSGGLHFAELSTGLGHTCGLTVSGSAYCWGNNYTNFLSSRIDSIPVAVSGGLRFTTISAGAFHACGLNVSGAALCWGSNDRGQLGDGTAVFLNDARHNEPIDVIGELRFASISAGGRHTCALTAAGSAYCWGNNQSGQLGDGTTILRNAPVAVSGGLRFAALSAGSASYTCGLTVSGIAYCWGNNVVSQLGDGTNSDRVSPVAVGGGLRFAMISAGDGHTCGLAVSGAAYCWGFNASGEAGDGTFIIRSTPVAVVGGFPAL